MQSEWKYFRNQNSPKTVLNVETVEFGYLIKFKNYLHNYVDAHFC